MPKRIGKLFYLKFIATYIPTAILASIASHAKINRVTVSSDFILKRRAWYSNLIRVPGNLMLYRRLAPIRVLSTSAWIDREKQIAGAVVENKHLRLKRLEGMTLVDFLATEKSAEKKLQAIVSALESLHDFHQKHQQSHGDACASNVMIHDPENGEMTATWFDFDVAHSGSDLLINKADDLNAFVMTLCVPSGRIPKFENLKQLYPDEKVWDSFYRLCKTQPNNVFHFAQRKRVQRQYFKHFRKQKEAGDQS